MNAKKQRKTFKSEFERGLREGVLLGKSELKEEIRVLLGIKNCPF